MEALELLGSRYIKPEQVAVGPVETLRAQNAATWRVVYIHRVSTTQGAAEQANLLKLLTTALVRSSEAKRLVLDFGEEQGFWNVITESEPQCESLRDWLQAEVDGAEKGEAILTAEQAAAMGEFARLFSRGVKQPARKAIAPKTPKAAVQAPPPKTPESIPVMPEILAAPHAEEPAAVLTSHLFKAPVQEVVEPVIETTIVGEAEHTPEPESWVEADEERPIVVPDETPAIIIPVPPAVSDKALRPSRLVGPPLEDADVPPLPPRKTYVSPPPLPTVPISVEPRVASVEPLIPEIVTELPDAVADQPKEVADAPKVVPIDTRPVEPKTDALKPDSLRTLEPRDEPPLRAVMRGASAQDGPLFANSMPKSPSLSKMAVFFIILGVVALLLIVVIVYLSTRT